MKRIRILLLILVFATGIYFLLRPSTSGFQQPIEATLQLDKTTLGISTIVSDLNVPWEIAWGPDNQIWYTEQSGTISKVDPHTGVKKLLLSIPDVYRQRTLGLLGMAIHPDKKLPYVFVDYTHLNKDSSIVSRLVRYTYTTDTLKDPLLLLELPGNTGHNGSRVAISPDGKVLLSTGDAAHDQLAPDTASLNGKVLRLNIDGTVPSDNPYPGNYLWSRGHRNIQGLVFTDKGRLFASEHGDATDDELNLIQKAGYYGWPSIEGYADRPDEKAHADSFPFIAPLKAWTPTIAPAGIDYYHSDKIPEWKNSLLLGTLKAASLHVIHLSSTQDAVTSEDIYFSGKYGRLRDICISPEGDVYIATSNRDWNPGKGFPLPHDDRILRIAALRPGEKVPATATRETAKAATVTAASSGAGIYKNYCEACHKPDGKGVPSSFPALAGNKLVTGDAKPLIQTILQGRSGDTKSKTSTYSEQMPAFNFLKDEEIAAVATYIRSSWGNSADSISTDTVTKTKQH
ncbi:PQQ-dependent sugar dehydrogenase [Chitinophaga flava]|uniref:Quinoprotein glucose dehydrogenase n=1 Tax=Chitinophaga flava TaxID=2259036 RepID=A0A365XYL2_9BACT|nr:PQQ-dependent sugar dehydrogenase [Chitinophaga flava]RBL91469.1 quinoprotein glucose dehydrogenase [Chitinophaga flava]